MSNNFLIVASTHNEIKNLNTKAKIFISGIGIINTIYNLTKYLIEKKDISIIFNVGIAGSFNKNINIGDVCFVKSDAIYEFGSENYNGKILDIFDNKTYHYEEKNIPLEIKKYINYLTPVNSITRLTTSGTKETIDKIKNNFKKIDIETLEGAAVNFVAEKFKIPVVQIRSISNYCEIRNKNNWKTQEAIKNMNTSIKKILQKYEI